MNIYLTNGHTYEGYVLFADEVMSIQLTYPIGELDYSTVRSDFENMDNVKGMIIEDIADENKKKDAYYRYSRLRMFQCTTKDNNDVYTISLEEIETSEVIKDIESDIADIKNSIDPVVNMDTMSLIELKKYKKQVIGKECTEQINAGIDFEIDGQTEHFTYNDKDQMNFEKMRNFVAMGIQYIPYHSSTTDTETNKCKFYKASDVTALYTQLVLLYLTKTTKCNFLYQFIDSTEDAETLKSLSMNSELTGELKTEYDNIINTTLQTLNNTSVNE